MYYERMGKLVYSPKHNVRGNRGRIVVLENCCIDEFFFSIMVNKITPETAVAFVRAVASLSFWWPLSKEASRFRVICFKIVRSLVCVNAIILIIPTIYTLYHNDYNLPQLTKLWCLLAAFLQIPTQITVCALQYERLQYLISEMEYNFKYAEPHEKEVYQRYTNRCVIFYGSSTLSLFLTAIGITIIAPLTAPNQTFPTDVKYPFDVKYQPVKSLVFVHQFSVLWSCSSVASLSNLIALLIWFSAARFEILAQQFRTANSICDIIECIKQHNKLLRYAQEVVYAVRLGLLSIIIICTWAIVASGLTIVSRSTLVDKGQFITLCITGLLEVYACAWPADYLIDTSSAIGRAVYESLWYNQGINLQKNLPFISLKGQTPIAVSASSFLPALSLNYYASYVSTAFSYLMTLRIVFVENGSPTED